jgi:hypothetical protein
MEGLWPVYGLYTVFMVISHLIFEYIRRIKRAYSVLLVIRLLGPSEGIVGRKD